MTGSQNENQETLLHCAADVGDSAMVTLLLERGADVNAQVLDGGVQ